MNAVFLDTSGLIAVVNTDDQWNATAEQAWLKLTASQYPLVTTSLVLIELADGLSRVRFRRLALQIVDSLNSSPNVLVIPSDAALEKRAWMLYRERMDKEWGMTDCLSMTVMKNHEMTQIFTADSHFEQAGFEILLK